LTAAELAARLRALDAPPPANSALPFFAPLDPFSPTFEGRMEISD